MQGYLKYLKNKKIKNWDFQFFSFKKTIVVTLKTFEQIF
jgi:hypothetical protein